MSDVMVGAGIGILATEFGYFLADLIFKEKGLKVRETYVVFDRYRHPSFVGFSVGLTVIPGSYTPYAGMHTDFKVGPTVGVQGAWFASPYVGVGGSFSAVMSIINLTLLPATGSKAGADLRSERAFRPPIWSIAIWACALQPTTTSLRRSFPLPAKRCTN